MRHFTGLYRLLLMKYDIVALCLMFVALTFTLSCTVCSIWRGASASSTGTLVYIDQLAWLSAVVAGASGELCLCGDVARIYAA